MQALNRAAQQVQLQGTDSIIVMYLKESFCQFIQLPSTLTVSEVNVSTLRAWFLHLSNMLDGSNVP